MQIKCLENKQDIMQFYMRIPKFKNYNVFQSHYYYNILDSGKGTFPYIISAEENNRVLGFILINIQNYFSSKLKYIASRSIISGGPLFGGNSDVLSFLLENYNKIYGRKVLYTQIRNIFSNDNYDSIYEKYSFEKIDHLNYVIDLSEGIDKIWHSVYPKRKNEIRKGLKEGIKVNEIIYVSDMIVAYNILERIYKKAKLPLPEYGFFKNALEIQCPKKIFRVIGGYHDSILVGVMFLLCFEGRVYNWYAAANPEYYKKYPNDVITWQSIVWSYENGFKYFDFGGAGNPAKEYGVREFKRKFGGTEVNYGRYECIHKPFAMKLAKTGFKLWQKLN